MVSVEVRLELENVELPARPGAHLRVWLVSGASEFFGPGGPRLGSYYTVKVNDELWRASLESLESRADRGTLMTLRIDSRYQ